jgi:hypothetical protein
MTDSKDQDQDQDQYKDKDKDKPNSLKDWLASTNKTLAKFVGALIVLGICLLSLKIFNLPISVAYVILLALFIVFFVMVILLSIENSVVKYLKESIWGQLVLYILVAVLSTLAYLWAAGEVNRLFLVNPNNLALTLTAIAAKRFFEYAIIALIVSYVLAMCLHLLAVVANKADLKHQELKYQSIKASGKELLSFLLLMLSIGVIGTLVGRISQIDDGLLQTVAVDIDFNKYHTCTGDEFKDSDGVLFLSANQILVAKNTGNLEWQFTKVPCE